MDLAKRKLGIGGSDVAAILGIKSFRTAVEIWEDKINPEVEEIDLRPDDHTAAMYWGNVFEKQIIDAYMLTEMTDVTYGETLYQFHHPEYPWLIANIDGIAHTKEHGEIILEVKHWGFDPNEEWGENGTDSIPLQYMYQVQHYMYVLDMPMAHVAAKIGCDFRVYRVPRSSLYVERILPKLKHFWFENVQKKIPPAPSNLRDVRVIYRESNDSEKEATDCQVESVKKIRRLRDRISKLEKILDKRKTGIAEEMGEHSRLVAGNESLVTFNSNRKGTRVFRVCK